MTPQPISQPKPLWSEQNLWVCQHEPEVYGKIAHVLLPKDDIRYKLTGDFATDWAGLGVNVMDKFN